MRLGDGGNTTRLARRSRTMAILLINLSVHGSWYGSVTSEASDTRDSRREAVMELHDLLIELRGASSPPAAREPETPTTTPAQRKPRTAASLQRANAQPTPRPVKPPLSVNAAALLPLVTKRGTRSQLRPLSALTDDDFNNAIDELLITGRINQSNPIADGDRYYWPA